MHKLYNLVIALYRLALILASPFNEKAGLWYNGRKDFFGKWKDFDAGERRLIWFHCASLGEFEQGRPVIEEIRKRDGNVFILLSFFSPSGYEIRKEYPHADAVCYLPADTAENARRFIGTFKPDIAVFVKYEFWYNYISTLNMNNIPLYLISANFRPGQVFFRWYGYWFGRMLHLFSHIFVQSESSRQLLNSAGVVNVSVAGDTRFDRVSTLAAGGKKIIPVADFTAGSFTIVAGSTWPADHDLLIRFMNETQHEIKMIIAPHEIHEFEISRLSKQFLKPALLFSSISIPHIAPAKILVIDNIGMLSSLYSYGDIAYVGGGFGRGIHNILEACTHGMPVIFGPRYGKFREAIEMIEAGGAFPVSNYAGLNGRFNEFFTNRDFLKKSGELAGRYVRSGTGASKRIVDKILDSPEI